LPYTALTERFCVTEMENVYWAGRSESLYKKDMFPICRVTSRIPQGNRMTKTCSFCSWSNKNTDPLHSSLHFEGWRYRKLL